MARFEIEAAGRRYEVEAPSMEAVTEALSGLGRPASGKGTTEAVQMPSLGARLGDMFSGNLRTEFPEAQEFGPAMDAAAQGRGQTGWWTTAPHSAALARSELSPNPQAQVDILRKHIPNLETQTDAGGNIMLRAPGEGVSEWSYLNRPGFSRRDVQEFGTQTAVTAPLVGAAGIGSTIFRRALIAAGLLGAGEVEKDVLATAAGSEQGVDPVRAGVVAGLGAVTAPGVPSAIASGLALPFRGTVAAAARGLINPELEAGRRVGTALTRDEQAATRAGAASRDLSDAEVQMAEISQQPIATIDTGGQTTRALARSAANTSPEARATLENFIDPRFETQAERASEFLTGLVGAPANAHVLRQGINQGSQATLPPLYQQAYRHHAARAGVHTPVLATLEAHPAMQAAMQAATAAMSRKQAAGTLATAARGPGGNPTLEFWDQVQRSLADRNSTLIRTGAREEARDVGQLRSRLVAELDATFPAYRNARGTAATFFRASDALEAGELFATQQYERTAARQAVNAMTPNEQLMFRQGFASRVVERLENTADRRSVVTQLTGSPAAREKLEIALGANGAREMEAFMHIEQVMDMARGSMGNSTTARQLAEMGLAGGGLALAGLTQNPGDPGAMTALFTAALLYGSRRGAAFADQRVVHRVAEMLVSQDPAVRQQAIQLAAHNGSMMRALRAFGDAIPGPVRALSAQQAGEAITE